MDTIEKSLNEAYNLGIDHAIGIIETELTGIIDPSVTALLTFELNKLKKKDNEG